MKTVIARIALPVLAGAALLSFASAGVSAAAVPAPEAAGLSMQQAAQNYTRGFFIKNTTSWDMRLDQMDNVGQDDGTPNLGTVLKPGQSMRYEKVFWFGQHKVTDLKFTLSKATTPGSPAITIMGFEAKLIVSPVGLAYTEITPEFRDLGPVKLDPGRDPFSQVTLIDSAASTIHVDAGADPQRAALLAGMCETYACNFESTRSAPAPALVSDVTGGYNNSSITQTYTKTLSTTVTSKSAIELSQNASLKVGEAISASMGSKYTNELTTGVTGTEVMSFPIQPHHRWWVTTTTQAIREYGNLTVRIGNTTFVVDNISVDVPKPGAKPKWGHDQVAMTDEEKATHPEG